MTDDFCKDVNIFWHSLGLYKQFAERLLGQTNFEDAVLVRGEILKGLPEIVTDEDADLVRQWQTELFELEATISKRHKIELSRSPPDPPSITLGECNRLLVIATGLGSLGVRFASTVKTIEKHREYRRGRKANEGKQEPQAKRDAAFKKAVKAEAKKLKIDPAQRGAAPLLRPGINRRLKTDYKVNSIYNLLKKHGFLTCITSS